MSERSGTVTFVFTDVEGSTMLLKQLGDRYGAVLAEHRRIVRDSFTAQGGEEVDTQGDAFFYVFSRAHGAATAAASAQQALAAHAWPDGVALRVRIGIHTGEPNVSDEGQYHGLGVHRTARIMAAGHGGQILVSQATASVLADDALPGIGFRDLGTHRLKDLDHPERIYQLDVAGLPTAYPPLRTEDDASSGTRRKLVIAGAVAAVAVAVVGVVAVVVRGESPGSLDQIDSNALGLVDARSGRITGEVPVGATPTSVAAGAGATWVTNLDAGTVSRIDSAKNIVVDTISVGTAPDGITIGGGAIWVANGLDATVSRIDPETNTVVQRIDVGNQPAGIAYTPGFVWVANRGDGTITKIDATSGRSVRRFPITANQLAYGDGDLWASDPTKNRVVRIEPATGSVIAEIPVGNGAAGVAYGGGSTWVANSLDGTVSRIDPTTNTVVAVRSTGDGPTAVAADSRGVWVSNQFGGTVVRIDPGTNDVTRRVAVGNRPQGIALKGGTLLVSVRQSGAGHRGGTLTVRMNRDLDSIDPAIAYDSTSWPVLRMTNDGLVAYNQVGGVAGTQLVPDLAVSIPTPTDGGKTYTFRLRPNIRYSNGKAVRPSDFRYTLERAFEIGKLPVPSYYSGIVGAARCQSHPKGCDLSRGIVANDETRTVTFRLLAPDPEFLYTLGLINAFVVPEGTPPKQAGTHPVPATGPYMIASYRPNHLLSLVRNPYFHEWSQAAQPDGYPDKIVFRIGGTPDGSANDVIAGRADAFSTSQSENPPSAGLLSTIQTRNASQVHSNPQPATIYFFLNTHVPPFDHPAVRRALNYAVDRLAAVGATGGPAVAVPTCQILPPEFPGYRPYCPYTLARSESGAWTAPDLARARALVAASGTRGMKVTVWSWKAIPGLGPLAVKLLRSLGYDASMKSWTDFRVIQDSRTKAQIGTLEWISDYPGPSGFFDAILTCRSFVTGPDNLNAAQFCDPKIDRQVAHAETAEEAGNRDAARVLWEGIDRQTVDAAPWVSLVNPKVVDVLSKRVGNYQYSPNGYGMLFDQLWVK